jgi:hypothetical protein
LNFEIGQAENLTPAMDFTHSNRDLWELVYNGMRHSVATGATMNAIARRKLQLGNSGSVRETSD